MTPIALASTIDDMIARLVALRLSPIVQNDAIWEDNPDHLRALSHLANDFARVCDPLFHEIAFQGGLSSRSGASEHANLVTDAIAENGLAFELSHRADEIEESRRQSDADEARAHGRRVSNHNDEHRLTARQLGVGTYR